MNRVFAGLAVFALTSTAAVAQDKVTREADKTVFRKKTTIDFTDVAIDGELTKPEGSYSVSKKKTTFKTLPIAAPRSSGTISGGIFQPHAVAISSISTVGGHQSSDMKLAAATAESTSAPATSPLRQAPSASITAKSAASTSAERPR